MGVPMGDVQLRRSWAHRALRLPDSRPGSRLFRGKDRQLTEDDLLDALERFDQEFGAGVNRTRAAYARFARENGLPSPTIFDRRGNGFTAMLAEARRRRRRR